MILSKPLLEYFPPGYKPRPGQVEVINKIEKFLLSNKKFCFLHAPTGSGKSHIAETIASVTSKANPKYAELVNTYLAYDKEQYEDLQLMYKPHGSFTLTINKQLQDQHKNLFKNISIFKGKGNYRCTVDESFNTQIAPCTISYIQKKKCLDNNSCPYYTARNNALIEPNTVLNYASFFNLPDHLKKREILICDEAHGLEDEIVGNFTTIVNYKSLSYNGIDINKLTSDKPNDARAWLTDLSEELKEVISSKANKSKFIDNKKELEMQHYRAELKDSVDYTLAHWDVVQYIVEDTIDDRTKGITGKKFTPVKIDKLTGCLFGYAEKIILMSATFIDIKVIAQTLGIKSDEYDIIELESTFDPKKSPIKFVTKYPLNYKTMKENLPHVLEVVKWIVDQHKGQKGVIHTHTKALALELQKVLKGDRFLFREEGTENAEIINDHKTRLKEDTVIISPSVTTGLDLPGELGEWQIILKLPYLPLKDPRVEIMKKEYPNWYVMKMLTTLIQACGRCTRNEKDTSVTYIVDGSIKDVLMQHMNRLPKYFQDRIQ